ncbi:MAG: copper-binding protein [bacterium]|nr:copper-binding protein [bacterium]
MKKLMVLALPALLALAGCGGGSGEAPAQELEVYDVRGEVVGLLENNVVELKHEEIEGWMKAMTMDFPVKDPAEFAKLSKGDRIESKLYVRGMDFYLAEIRVIPAAEE